MQKREGHKGQTILEFFLATYVWGEREDTHKVYLFWYGIGTLLIRLFVLLCAARKKAGGKSHSVHG